MAVASTPTLATLLSGVVKTVAATALIGGGTMVLRNAQESAVQREQIAEHDRRISAVESLKDKLEITNNNIIILNERLKNIPPSVPR